MVIRLIAVNNTTKILIDVVLEIKLQIKKQHVSVYHWPSSGFIVTMS
jgi:hypothetical protein